MPTSMLRADGTLVITPTPDQVGTYQFSVVANDGVLSTTVPVDLTVPADPVTTTRISGFVDDDRCAPLPGVTVTARPVQATTGSDGSFLLDFGATPPASIPTGYTVRASCWGANVSVGGRGDVAACWATTSTTA